MALTHFDAQGAAHMVDVGAKDETLRMARAAGRIVMRPETLALVRAGTAKKGDVLGVARIAAIQAAKRTADLIPLATPDPDHPRRRRVRRRRRSPGGDPDGHCRDGRPHRGRDGGPDRRQRSGC